MEFEKKDFDSLKVKVHLYGDDISLANEIHLFAENPVFHRKVKGLKQNVLLKYVVFMYDSGSPLLKIEDLIKRKLTAMRYAGLDIETMDSISDNIQNVLKGSNENVNKMMIKYCRNQRNTKFTMICSFEEFFYRQNEELLKVNDDNKKKDIIKNIKDLERDISVAKLELFSQDSSEDIERALYEEIEREDLQLRPEDIAEKLANGETI